MLCSLIQAPSTLRKVLVARAIPCWIASSKLRSEMALISVIRATGMALPSLRQTARRLLSGIAVDLSGVNLTHGEWHGPVVHTVRLMRFLVASAALDERVVQRFLAA